MKKENKTLSKSIFETIAKFISEVGLFSFLVGVVIPCIGVLILLVAGILNGLGVNIK